MNFFPLAAIVDGICVKLRDNFAYRIYAEEVKQGLQTPCFFVKLLNNANHPMLSERSRRVSSFCIHYFPENSNEPKAECLAMMESLFAALEYIEIDGNLIRGVDMQGELHDGILLFYVNYNLFIRKIDEPTMMEVLETHQTQTNN